MKFQSEGHQAGRAYPPLRACQVGEFCIPCRPLGPSPAEVHEACPPCRGQSAFFSLPIEVFLIIQQHLQRNTQNYA